MTDFYEGTKRASALYPLLQDDLSRDIFWTRLKFDLCPSADTLLRLVRLSGIITQEEYDTQLNWKNTVNTLARQGRRLVLYGAGMRGKTIAKCLTNDGVDFFGFCDKQFDKFENGFLDKPVVSPSYLIEHHEEFCVIITSAAFWEEILGVLRGDGFPLEYVLPYFSDYYALHGRSIQEQYFEFPSLFPKGTAFVDAGCFDGQDSLHFAEWCSGAYSKIFAFEPDPTNYEHCRENLKDLSRTEVIHAGLSDHLTEAAFLSYGQAHSRFVESKKERHIVDETLLGASPKIIRLTALDSLTEREHIGFIKMDIEGAEWQALHGAEKTILRDKPLLAICVYHVPGDTLAIMDYLAGLVPEYRFWLRHYDTSNTETVLYAAVVAT